MPTSAGSQKIVHPLYSQWAPTWRTALDVYEGTGGFIDPQRPYLVPHPREYLDHSIKDTETEKMVPNPNPVKPSPKFLMRRRLARYENVSATILDAVMGALFLQSPTRSFGGDTENEQVRAWWSDADGKGTHIDTVMQDTWTVAGAFGHAILLMEKPDEEAESQADVKLPRVCRYTPLDLIDWLEDEYGEVTAVKLREPTPREDFGKRLVSTDYRIRVVDQTEWTLYDHKGMKIDGAAHGFGRLPVEFLYGKRRPLTPVIGKAVMGDPQLYIDLYNLTSECRELLRNQTFAQLNIPIGEQGSVQHEMEMMGQQHGTTAVLFSSHPAQFISPQADNVRAYHEHLDRLTRMIYRLASLPWEGDSKDAESADSRKIKRSEMHQSLVKYANELQRTDRGLLDLVYRALYGAEAAEKRMETDQVTVAYSENFEPVDLEALASQIGEALGLDLGETANKEIKKRGVRSFLPDLSHELQKKSDAEIDAMKVMSEDDKRKEALDAAAARFAQRPGQKPIPPKVPAA